MPSDFTGTMTATGTNQPALQRDHYYTWYPSLSSHLCIASPDGRWQRSGRAVGGSRRPMAAGNGVSHLSLGLNDTMAVNALRLARVHKH